MLRISRATVEKGRQISKGALRVSVLGALLGVLATGYLWLKAEPTSPRAYSLGGSRTQAGSEESVTLAPPLRHTVASEARHAAALPSDAPADERAAAAERVIRGTVSGSEGKLLVGAEVCLTQSRLGGDTACARTDASGAFRMPPGAAGDLLVATAPAHEARVRGLPPSPGLESIDIVLGPSTTPNVRGVVVDAVGGPVERALVRVQGGGVDPAGCAWSDESGRFGLAVAPGLITLGAQAEAYAPAQVEIEAPADQVSLVLAAASTLNGEVVEDATGRAVPTVTVSAYADSMAHPSAQSAVTDEAGRFVLSGLHAGKYQLKASGVSWGGGEAWASVGVAEMSAPIVLRVHAAATLTGVVRVRGEACSSGAVWLRGSAFNGNSTNARGEVSLTGILPGEYDVSVECAGGITLSDHIVIGTRPLHREWDLGAGATLHGRLERANGAAIRLPLRLIPPAAAAAESSAPRALVECAVDEGGSFECRGLEPGRYEFSVGGQDLVSAGSIVIDPAVSEPPPAVVRLPAVASILVQLAGAGVGAGSFHVLARRANAPALRAEPSAEGHWFRDVALGTYTVYVGPTSASAENARQVTLSADAQVARVELTGPALLSISGVVVDASGVPAPEVWLAAQSSESDVPGAIAGTPVLTDERGEFSLEGLIPGAYDISSNGPSHLVEAARAGARGLVLQLRE
jgi:carboxypeptidase family protein